MTKQEFLAFSLPYELKTNIRVTNDELPIYSIIGLLYGSINYCRVKEEGNQDYLLPINIIMPILHPLSDLTKEIEHNGEKFVPIDRIKESQHHLFLRDDITNPLEGLQFSEFRKLIEWKFDLADLISKGEAIDVNTLEINPYK